MDVRYRFRKRLEHASPKQKIKYYQSRYDEKRLGQIFWLLQSFAGQRGGFRTHEKIFADYRKKKVFDSVSVKDELLKYDVISFDVFDTLLGRNVSRPADIFGLLEKKTGVSGFAGYRTEAEKTARKRRYARCRSAEVTIEEIYQTMLQEWNNALTGRNMEPETWIREEFKMERHCCSADPVLQQMVNMLLANGKRIIAVSDMYLHQQQIRELLRSCGYTALEEIYVSCDYRAGKSDGKLFPIIFQKIGTDQRLAHVGDNFYSDVYMHKNLDMGAIHYIKDGGSQNETNSFDHGNYRNGRFASV